MRIRFAIPDQSPSSKSFQNFFHASRIRVASAFSFSIASPLLPRALTALRTFHALDHAAGCCHGIGCAPPGRAVVNSKRP
jgi:hypothetical protein